MTELSPITLAEIEEVAAWLLARDEDEAHPERYIEHWRCIGRHREAKHEGDCTKKPFTCMRCVYDATTSAAKQILEARAGIATVPAPGVVEEVARTFYDKWCTVRHGEEICAWEDLPHLSPSDYEAVMQAAEATIASLPSLSGGWRDIESAPKDGTTIDLWCREAKTGASDRRTDCYWDWMTDWLGNEEEGWVNLFQPNRDWEPTHWRPLPTAPGVTEQPPVGGWRDGAEAMRPDPKRLNDLAAFFEQEVSTIASRRISTARAQKLALDTFDVLTPIPPSGKESERG